MKVKSKTFAIIVVILAILLIGALIYFFVNRNNNDETDNQLINWTCGASNLVVCSISWLIEIYKYEEK